MARQPSGKQDRPPATHINFRLDGPSIALDPRIHAFRPDIADLALAGQVFAPHYARPRRYRMSTSAMVMQAPSHKAEAVSQLLPGEEFAVLDMTGGWAWGYCVHDHYVGYLRTDALTDIGTAPTHIVSVPVALAFSAADIKAPLAARLPMGARITAYEQNEAGFIRSDAGWFHPRHISPLDSPETDPVAIAERLLNTPYLWSGRGGDGLDCSGLVQLALGMCGIFAMRDSDQQLATLGVRIDAQSLRRGDLVFFPGHVGFMVDRERLIHASGKAMRVVREPLADVVGLLRADHAEPIIAAKRL